MPSPGPTIEKLMTITRAELAASLVSLDPQARLDSTDTAEFRIGGHRATVRFMALPVRVLGGLVRLPQARVTLDLSTIAECERAAVLRAFDIAFQRGGG